MRTDGDAGLPGQRDLASRLGAIGEQQSALCMNGRGRSARQGLDHPGFVVDMLYGDEARERVWQMDKASGSNRQPHGIARPAQHRLMLRG